MPFAQVDAGFNGLVSDNNFKEVIAQRDDLTRIDGGRMLPQAGTFHAGLILSQFTSGPNAGLWAPFSSANSSATDGSQSAGGVLYAGADIAANGYGSEIRVITGGCVFADLCLVATNGVEAQATPAQLSALGGRLKIVHGQNLLKF